MEQRILPKESGTHFSDQEIVDLKIRQGDASRSEVLRILARLEAAEKFINHYPWENDERWVGCQELEAWRKAAGRE